MARTGATTSSSVAALDGTAVEDLLRDAIQAIVDHARLMHWVERIEDSDGPSALLVERPEPDGDRLGYPSAVSAYREMSAVVDEM